MHAERSEIDSRAMGRSVFALRSVDSTMDWTTFEATELIPHRPCYVSARLPADGLREIHYLERHGFQYIETQLRLALRLFRPFPVPELPYVYERVTDAALLPEIHALASSAIVMDRVSLDPELGPQLSAARYAAYLDQSFAAEDEAVTRLRDASGRTVAFRSHRRTAPDKVLCLLGGIHPADQGLGLGPLIACHEFNAFFADGVRECVTHISAANLPIFNLEAARLGFRAQASLVVLRKVYR